MKRKRNAYCRESGVSETVGFILIFGIMVTGISIVTLYGYPALLQEQQNTNVRNMERNMIVLQNDMKALTYKNVPFKETSLQVAGGTLSIYPGNLTSKFIINVTDLTGYHSQEYSLGEIHYESQDGTTTISLENGAVHSRFWSSPNGSAMLSEPRWFYDDATKTFVMSFINLTASDYIAQTGIGTVRMRITDSTQTEYSISDGNNVNIKYIPDIKNNYYIAWINYFNRPELKMHENSTPGSYNLNPGAKKLVIKTYNITILSL